MGYVTSARRALAAVAATALMVSGCATTGGGSGGPMSELDRANGRCVASVLLGAVAGAIVGNNVGDGNAGRGAAIGATAGGVYCIVIREAAREKDAILAYQAAAAQRGSAGTDQWTAASGKRMVMNTTVEENVAETAAVADSGVSAPQARCRFSTSSVTIEGTGAASLGRQKWCENEDGNWVMA